MKSIAMLKIKWDSTSTCLTPVVTVNQSVCSCPTHTQLSDQSYMISIMEMNLWGMPYILVNFHMDALWMQSIAFQNSMKFWMIGCCHSSHGSITFLRTKTWSKQRLPCRKPACCSQRVVSVKLRTLFRISWLRVLHGTENRIMPLQFEHWLRSPFFGTQTIPPRF